MTTYTSTSLLEDLIEHIKRDCLASIQIRLQDELRPQLERIYSEECAKMAVRLTSVMSFERMGTDLRIVIHKVLEDKQP